MNYRIEQKEAFEVFGLELKTTVINGQCFKDIPEFWLKCVQDGRFQELLQAAGKKSGELVDVGVTYAHNPNGNLSYMLGCIKRDRAVPPDTPFFLFPSRRGRFFKPNGKAKAMMKSFMRFGEESIPSGFPWQATSMPIAIMIWKCITAMNRRATV